MLKIDAIGNLGRDAELRVHNGKEFATFTLAVNKTYKNQQGQKIEETTWLSCTTSNLNVAQYLLKGTRVCIRGDVSLTTYRDKQGQARAGMDVRVTELELLGSPATEKTTDHIETDTPAWVEE